MSSIIPHHTLTEKRRWKFVSTAPCGFSWDHRCDLRVLLIRLRVKVASSVNGVNGSNWRLVCNQWQNFRRMALSPGFRFCTSCGWNEYKPASWNVRHTRVRETPISAEFSRGSSRATLYHIKNVFLFLLVLFTYPFRWNMSTGKRTAFTQCIEHLVKHSTIRNSVHREPSTVFFNSSSGTTIAEAINIHHISIFGICEGVQHFSQHSNNVTINSHNS